MKNIKELYSSDRYEPSYDIDDSDFKFSDSNASETQARRLLWLSSFSSLLPLIWLSMVLYRVAVCSAGACGHYFYWYESQAMLSIGSRATYVGPVISLLCLLVARFKLKNRRYKWHAVLLAPWLGFHLYVLAL